jgi:vesicle coat complex subunit
MYSVSTCALRQCPFIHGLLSVLLTDCITTILTLNCYVHTNTDRYESIIGTLCENLDTLDEPEAKASIIWIIGEYAERIDNADEQLDHFLETFEEEVQC